MTNTEKEWLCALQRQIDAAYARAIKLPKWLTGLERQGMTTHEQEPPKCPECGSEKIEAGFGLAGGGYGAYMYCEDCHAIFDKVQEYDD